MRIRYNDGSQEDIDPQKAAQLIFASQRFGDKDWPFKIEIDEEMSETERDNMIRQVEYYLDDLRVRRRWDGFLNL